MPRETIRRLEESAARLLVAGAHLAGSDEGFARDADALDKLAKQLGDRAPVLGQLGQAAQRVRSAKGNAVTAELVGLATQVGQVRAAQVALAPAPGPDARFEARPAPDTPLQARDLYELREALVTPGPGRLPKLEGALERGDVADLRILDALVFALGDGYLGQKVADEALPAVGAAAVPSLRRRFDPKGGVHDARRLRALVAIEKAGAKDLVIQALREGKPALREVAYDAVADHCPALPELEQELIAAATKEGAADVQRAAVRALAGYGAAAALEALLPLLDDERPEVAAAAAEALGRSTHPQVVDRLLARLEALLAPPPPEEKKKATKKKAAKKAPKGKPAKPPKDEKALAKLRIEWTLRALAPHRDPRIAARALELLDDHPAAAAEAVLKSGDAKGRARVADLLASDDKAVLEDARPYRRHRSYYYDYGQDDDEDDERGRGALAVAVRAALSLGGDEAWKRLSAVFKAKDRTKGAGALRVAAVVEALRPGADPRWVDLLTKELKEGGDHGAQVAEALGRIGGDAAKAALLKALQAEAKKDKVAASQAGFLRGLAQGLKRLGAKEALDPLLAVAMRGDWSLWWTVREAVVELAEPKTCDLVRDLLAKAEADKRQTHRQYWLRHLLSALIDRFPGH